MSEAWSGVNLVFFLTATRCWSDTPSVQGAFRGMDKSGHDPRVLLKSRDQGPLPPPCSPFFLSL